MDSVFSVEKFIEKWQSKGDEKSETQKFWLELLSEVLSVPSPTQSIDFEKRVELEHVSFIDGYTRSRIVSASRRTSRKTLCFVARTLYKSGKNCLTKKPEYILCPSSVLAVC